jgi:hypothetical protein
MSRDVRVSLLETESKLTGAVVVEKDLLVSTSCGSIYKYLSGCNRVCTVYSNNRNVPISSMEYARNRGLFVIGDWAGVVTHLSLDRGMFREISKCTVAKEPIKKIKALSGGGLVLSSTTALYHCNGGNILSSIPLGTFVLEFIECGNMVVAISGFKVYFIQRGTAMAVVGESNIHSHSGNNNTLLSVYSKVQGAEIESTGTTVDGTVVRIQISLDTMEICGYETIHSLEDILYKGRSLREQVSSVWIRDLLPLGDHVLYAVEGFLVDPEKNSVVECSPGKAAIRTVGVQGCIFVVDIERTIALVRQAENGTSTIEDLEREIEGGFI